MGWVWLVIGAGAALLLLSVVGVWRSWSREKQHTSRAIAVWRERARSAYEKVQSIGQEMTPDLCFRMGDAGFRRDVLREEPTPEDRSTLERWSRLERAEREVTSELFTLEAGSPLPDWPERVRVVIDAVGSLKRASEVCSTAQLRFRRAELAADLDAQEAYRRRIDAETILSESRQALEAALSLLRSIL